MSKKWWEKLPKDGGKIVMLGDLSPFIWTVPIEDINKETGLLKCDGIPYCPFCNKTLEDIKATAERLRPKYDHTKDLCVRNDKSQ